MTSTDMRSRRRRSPDVNITPLIDVVFLLLIFFMVSTTFDQYSELRIELPSASAEPQTEVRPTTIELAIDRQGRYYVNQDEVINTTVDTLSRALKKALDGREPMPVVISADASTPHQAVVSAMEAAGRAGLYQISFSTARNGQE